MPEPEGLGSGWPLCALDVTPLTRGQVPAKGVVIRRARGTVPLLGPAQAIAPARRHHLPSGRPAGHSSGVSPSQVNLHPHFAPASRHQPLPAAPRLPKIKGRNRERRCGEHPENPTHVKDEQRDECHHHADDGCDLPLPTRPRHASASVLPTRAAQRLRGLPFIASFRPGAPGSASHKNGTPNRSMSSSRGAPGSGPLREIAAAKVAHSQHLKWTRSGDFALRGKRNTAVWRSRAEILLRNARR